MRFIFLHELERLATAIERVVHDVPGTTSAFAERLEGGHYVEIIPDRAAAARYGVSVADVQNVVAVALGGETVTTTVEGRERYGVNVRYPRGLRDEPRAIAEQVLVPTPGGAMVPLGQVASIRITEGPPSIRTEDAQPVAYVYVDLAARDVGSYSLGGIRASVAVKTASWRKTPRRGRTAASKEPRAHAVSALPDNRSPPRP